MWGNWAVLCTHCRHAVAAHRCNQPVWHWRCRRCPTLRRAPELKYKRGEGQLEHTFLRGGSSVDEAGDEGQGGVLETKRSIASENSDAAWLSRLDLRRLAFDRRCEEEL